MDLFDTVAEADFIDVTETSSTLKTTALFKYVQPKLKLTAKNKDKPAADLSEEITRLVYCLA